MNDSNLQVLKYKNRTAMGEAAAKLVLKKIAELLSKQQYVNIIFAAAPSQNEFLAALVKNEVIDWERVNAFHMDEYIGLPEGDTRTFALFLKERIFNKLPFHDVNYINGNALDLEAECTHYANLLKQYPADIVFMGIGENGHIAFNDPHVADFNDPLLVKTVSLDEACRQQQVNDECFDALDDVPRNALTLTVPALMAAKYVYCMVPGEKKAQAVYNTVNDNITAASPATILRKHPNAILFLDEDSGRLLIHD